MRRNLGAVLLLLATCHAAGGSQSEDGRPPLRDVTVTSIDLDDLDLEGIQVTVHLRATANVSATLQTLIFDRASIGDLRINLPPLRGPITLRENQSLEGPRIVRVRLSYRELDSLEPLRRLIESRRGRFRATTRGRLALNLFQKIALMTGTAWVVTTVDQEVPVELRGGTFARSAGLAALTVAEPVWRAGRAMQAHADAAIAARASAALERSIVSLETHYDVKSSTGDTARLRHAFTGFLVDEFTLLAPAEAVEPWLFDHAFAEAAGRGEVSVVPSSLEIVARPAAPSGPTMRLTSERKDIQVLKVQSGSETAVSAATKKRFRLRLRASDSNVALMRLNGWRGAGVTPIVTDLPAEWQPATVVRLRREQDRIEAVFLQTAVRSNDGRVELRDPVDTDAFGSPIWTEAGVVGVVQEDTSGADLKRALSALNFTVHSAAKH